jgi:pimeloyl-ACP methyl ester carboxylesterase
MQRVHEFFGEKIAYSIQGKGRTIVLIHGFLGSKKLWGPIFNRLKLSFQVIAFDLPGHGDSDCIGYVHSMEMMAELVKSILDSHKIRKAVLVGHSLGGYVSLAFAENYPDRLHGLILINSTANSDSELRINSRNQLIKLIKHNKERAVEALVPSFFVGESKKINRLKSKYLKEANKCSARGIIASVEGMKIRTDREIVLKFSPYPYLYIIGELDPVLNWKGLCEQAKLGDRGFESVLNYSSHMSFLEEEGKVYSLIKKFAKNLFL